MNQPILEEFDIERIVPGYTAPAVASHCGDRAALNAAEHNARHWHSPLPGALKPGTQAHVQETCRMFSDTFNPYRPSVLDWPALDRATLHCIVSLPIWDIAVQTEGKARLRISAYATTLSDPDMRAALAQNAWEESRHKEELSRMVAAYGIALASEAPYEYPRDADGREHRQDNNFTVSGAQAVSAGDVSVRDLMTVCLQENDRRFRGYDARLLRSTTMPRLVRLALRFVRGAARPT